MSGVIQPTRADVVIVRRSGERHETIDIERWDVHTFGGELLAPNFATREAAEAVDAGSRRIEPCRCSTKTTRSAPIRRSGCWLPIARRYPDGR